MTDAEVKKCNHSLRTGAHRKSDQHRDDLCGGGLRKRAWNEQRSRGRWLNRSTGAVPEWGEALVLVVDTQSVRTQQH